MLNEPASEVVVAVAIDEQLKIITPVESPVMAAPDLLQPTSITEEVAIEANTSEAVQAAEPMPPAAPVAALVNETVKSEPVAAVTVVAIAPKPAPAPAEKDEKATLMECLAKAEAQVADIKRKLEERRASERASIIRQVQHFVAEYNLTTAEAGFLTPAVKVNVAQKTEEESSRENREVRHVSPKYRDPVSGKTWTGRGKSPNFISQAVLAGRSKQEFLIPVSEHEHEHVGASTDSSATKFDS